VIITCIKKYHTEMDVKSGSFYHQMPKSVPFVALQISDWKLISAYMQLLYFWTLFIVLSIEVGTSSIDWAQLSRIFPEDADRVQPLKCCL
jgi:hypothetical protein